MRVKDIPSATADEMLQHLLDGVRNLQNGHFTGWVIEDFPGVYGEIARALNAHADMLARFAQEHHRLMEEVGVTGRLGGQMQVDDAKGGWKTMLDDVNRMSAHVTDQFRDGANAVHDLLSGKNNTRVTARRIQGEFAEFARQLNRLADGYQERSSAPTLG